MQLTIHRGMKGLAADLAVELVKHTMQKETEVEYLTLLYLDSDDRILGHALLKREGLALADSVRLLLSPMSRLAAERTILVRNRLGTSHPEEDDFTLARRMFALTRGVKEMKPADYLIVGSDDDQVTFLRTPQRAG